MTAVASPAQAVAALHGTPVRIGLLHSYRSSPLTAEMNARLQADLEAEGLVEGRDYVLVSRYADGNYGAFPALVDELLSQRVNVVIVRTILAAQSLRARAPDLPVVMDGLNDPVGAGLAERLDRPGGSITGIANVVEGLVPRLLDLAQAALPAVRRLAVLHNPANPSNARLMGQAMLEAESRGLSLNSVPIPSADALGGALTRISSDRPDAVLVLQDSMFAGVAAEIMARMRADRIPVFSSLLPLAREGAIVTAYPDERPQHGRAASYIARILAGANPGELPIVLRPRRVVVNRAAAASLGLALPEQLLAEADEVIDSVEKAPPPGRGTLSRTRRVPLALKFAAAFVGLVTLVLLVNGAVNLWLSYEEAKRAALRVQQEKAHAASERIDQFVSEIESQIGWTTRQEWRRIGLEQQRYDFIRLLRQAPAVTELSFLDGNGREQLKVSRLEPDAVGSNADFSADPRFTRAVADKVWFGPVYFRRGSEPYMSIGVAHAGRNAGVTVADVNLKLIWDVIQAIRVGEEGHAYVVNAQGRLIAHPDMSLVLRDTDLSRRPQVSAALAAQSGGQVLQRASTAAIGQDLQGRSVLTAYNAIPRLGWIVFVQSPVREAMAPVYTALTQSGILLALGLLLALTAGTFLSRRMVGPIHQLQGGAERLGEGDLSQRIAIRTGDEIETLADRFNLMASRIQESYETLEARVEERTRELQEALEYQTATGEVLSVISRSPNDLQPVLDTIVETAHDLCQARYALFFRLGPDGLYHLATSKDADAVRSLDWLRSHPIAKGDGTATGLAALEQRTIHFPDALADPRFTDFKRQQQSKARTQLAVPLIRAGAVIGVIFLARTEVKPFTDRQIELVTTFADQAVIAISNVGLFEEVQTRTAELSESLEYQTAISDVLGVISRSPNELQPVLDAIVAISARICEAYIGDIFLAEGDSVRVAATMGDMARPLGSIPLDRTTVMGRSIIDCAPVHVEDLLNAGREYPAGQRLAAQFGHRTTLAVPLVHRRQSLGAILLRRETVQPFAEKQIALLKTFADQAVIAINNVGLFEEVQARTAELTEALQQQTATAEVLKVISRSAFDLQTVLDTLCASAVRLCDADRGVIFQRDGDLYRLAANHGFSPEFESYARANPFHAGRGSTTGRVALEGRTIHVPDVLADPEYNAEGYQRYGGYRTNLGVPLLREGIPIGVFVLTRPMVKPFTDRQVELVETFADQAVIAIENARLFKAVKRRTKELRHSLEELQAAQDRLVQTEKLASLGQLTAGIAHEIKNPLNFVNNFSSLSGELVDELRDVLAGVAIDGKTRAEVDEIADLLRGNLDKVAHHGKRADSIVKNMLLHSREGSGERRGVDLNATVEESLNLAYHGARAEKPGFNITLQKNLDPAVGEVEIYPQEFIRVLLNLVSNGFYAANKKAEGAGGAFEPTLAASTRALGDQVEIRIRDNGTGIPDEVKAKMFNPFFTTKPAGEGTGLGLSLSHDIVVKQHGGTIGVETVPGAFTEFVITLPRSAPSAGARRPS